MKIIILIVLILFLPTFTFSGEVDNIIKQQRDNKGKEEKEEKERNRRKRDEERKEAEARDKRKRELKAREQCLDKITDVVALKIKELMDKDVRFKKPNINTESFKYINGKKYAVYYNAIALVRTSRYEDKLMVLQDDEQLNSRTCMYFRPAAGRTVQICLIFHDSFWNLEINAVSDSSKYIEFKSYDIKEIEKKRAMINNNIVKAIEASIKKYSDK